MSSPRTALGRYGLLASTVAMSLALLATGFAGYSAARGASASLVQARGIDVTLLLRRELHLADTLDAQALSNIVDELSEQEVTYLAVLDGRGQVLASAGVPASGDTLGPVSSAGNVRWRTIGGRVRVTGGIGRPWRNRRIERGPRSGLSFAVEFLPGPATALTSRALATLVLSCCAAA